MMMAQGRQPGQPIFWLRPALFFGIGGAIFVYLTLWLVQGVLLMLGDDHVIQGAHGAQAVAIATVIASVIGVLVLMWFFGRMRNQAIGIVIAWLALYVLIWMIGVVLSGMSFPIYLICWVIFGLAGGRLLRADLTEQRAATAGFGQGSSSLMRSSKFGRIPADTVVLLTQHARYATGPISSALPEGAPAELRDFTVRAVLDRTLRDWWENSNTDGLMPEDVDDLRSFVAMGAALATPPGVAVALGDDLARAIYRATLIALLDDWLANWNANGVAGPPRR